METPFHRYPHPSSSSNNNMFDSRPLFGPRPTSVRWVKHWVPQDVIPNGRKCYILKWVSEHTLRDLQERESESTAPEPEPEPTSEVLFLCSYEGCGKTFTDAGALRKHSHIHGERQYICHYEGCGKKFLDSSKLKRHFLIHTGERDFICPHEGCGKAFSLDFNLKSHMKTHSQENYHVCPYPECGKRYAHEYKLKNHISAQHEKNSVLDTPKYNPPPIEKLPKTPKPSSGTYGSASSDRPFACPYERCDKTYIHEYKLKLHLKREHMVEENVVKAVPTAEQEMDEASDQDNYVGKRVNVKSQKRSRPKPSLKMPRAKVSKRKGSSPTFSPLTARKSWPVKDEVYEEEDSEETEEDRDHVEDGWRFTENNEDDDEETEDED